MPIFPTTTLPYSEIGPFLERLGFEPNMVREFTMNPSDVTVTLYKSNERGSKYVDLETGEPAVETLKFKVRPT
jgi:hypothetical protein